jgi:hypothetical protein
MNEEIIVRVVENNIRRICNRVKGLPVITEGGIIREEQQLQSQMNKLIELKGESYANAFRLHCVNNLTH